MSLANDGKALLEFQLIKAGWGFLEMAVNLHTHDIWNPEDSLGCHSEPPMRGSLWYATEGFLTSQGVPGSFSTC